MKLEVGKSYRSRGGDVFGPVYRCDATMMFGSGRYPFRVSGKNLSWSEDGRYNLEFDRHQLDLIEEVGTAQPAASADGSPPALKLTLTTDSEARKSIMLVAACQDYIPAAMVKFAEHAKAGNDKHNKGQPIHHARWKSTDHEECIARHLMDMRDIRAYIRRNGATPEAVKALISEATAEFWRAGVLLQELCEQYEGAPLAPGARLEGEPL